MEYLTINSFRFGLDTRRGENVSQPGTLTTLHNAFVNPGGEIEKRKAIVEFADVSMFDTDGNPGTFWLEMTDDGLTVFGSANPYGGSAPSLLAAMPAGITYQQLQHPSVSAALVAYDETKHRMSEVIHSQNFNGKAVVIAQYTDGRKFVFYDGSVVKQSFMGRVMDGENDKDSIAQRIYEILNDTFDDWNLSVTGEVVTVKTPLGTWIEYAEEDSDAAGDVLVTKIQGEVTASAGVAAYARFQMTDVNANATNITVTAPDDAGTGTVTLISNHVRSGNTVEAMSRLAALMDSALTGDIKYKVVFDGTDTITVFAPVEKGDSWNAKNLNVAWDGDAGDFGAGGAAAYSAYIEAHLGEIKGAKFGYAASDTVVSGDGYGGDLSLYKRATLHILGGTPPFTVTWSIPEAVPQVVTGLFARATQVYFRKKLSKDTEFYDPAVSCTIEDATPSTVTSDNVIRVHLTYTGLD